MVCGKGAIIPTSLYRMVFRFSAFAGSDTFCAKNCINSSYIVYLLASTSYTVATAVSWTASAEHIIISLSAFMIFFTRERGKLATLSVEEDGMFMIYPSLESIIYFMGGGSSDSDRTFCIFVEQ